MHARAMRRLPTACAAGAAAAGGAARRGLSVSAAKAFAGKGVARWAVRGAVAGEQDGADSRGLPSGDLARRVFGLPCQAYASLGAARQVEERMGDSGGAATRARHVVFAGRSNAGKSTLLNALFGRGLGGANKLARTSKTPGRTQAVNLYGLGDANSPRAFVADLPGYGWAKNAGGGAAHRWNVAMGLYLRTAHAGGQLGRVFVLCDSRRGLAAADLDFMRFLDDEGLPYQVVLTKTDRVRAAALVDAVERAQVLLRAPGRCAYPPYVLAVSGRDRAGLEGLRREIGGALLGPPAPDAAALVAASLEHAATGGARR